MTWAFEASKPTPSEALPPTRPYLLILPKNASPWSLSIWIFEPMEPFLFKALHSVSRVLKERLAQICATFGIIWDAAVVGTLVHTCLRSMGSTVSPALWPLASVQQVERVACGHLLSGSSHCPGQRTPVQFCQHCTGQALDNQGSHCGPSCAHLGQQDCVQVDQAAAAVYISPRNTVS